ncbi:MAG: ribonuclease D, partial [Alphaproteobacteria bacterium]|nr:ribonuclease D [Alphaproteobacteria bacterium]
LHQIKEKLDLLLQRENREDLAKFCFDFLKTRSKLDLTGFDNLDIFSH